MGSVAHIIPDQRLLDDAEVLERAAGILKARSRKPRGILLTAFCNVLAGEARRIRKEAGQ